MKRILTTVAAIIIAVAAYAQMGRYSFGVGPMNTATNSNYATTAGYFAGYEGTALTRTSLFGSLAGQNATYVQKSVGLGYGALYMASNCTSCVAIGDTAGARWRNANGWVQVGNALVYTNGYLNIGNGLIRGNASRMIIGSFDTGDFVKDPNSGVILFDRFFFSLSDEEGERGRFWAYDINLDSGGYSTISSNNGRLAASNGFCIGTEGSGIALTRNGDCIMATTTNGVNEVATIGGLGVLRFENGGLAVYTNGVKAGTLTFTPANQ